MTTAQNSLQCVAAGAAAGLLYWLAMPGVGWGMLGFVAFLPLYSHRPERDCEAITAGLLAGVTATLGVCSWLPFAMRSMLNAPPVLTWLGLAALCSWHAIRFAAAAWVNHRLRERAVPGWLRLPASLIVSELLVPVPFPFSIAVTLHEAPVLLQIADLGGRMGIVFVLGATTAALGDALAAARAQGSGRGIWPRFAVGLLPLTLTIAYGVPRARQVDQATALAPALRVGLVQANVAPQVKRSDPAASLREHVQLTRELVSQQAPDLIVWSETAMPMPLDDRLLASGLRRRLGNDFPMPLLVGAVVKHEAPPLSDTLSNSALLSQGDGFVCPACRYDKQTLLPFAEELPFDLPRLAQMRASKFRSSGHNNRALPFDATHRIAVLICFETIFPERVRRLVRRDQPHLLVNMTNDGWFGATDEPRLHLALAKLRAIENRRFMVRVATTGVSAIVDPVGRVALSIPRGVREARVGSVAWFSSATVYGTLGDFPWWLLAFVTVLTVLRRPKRTQST